MLLGAELHIYTDHKNIFNVGNLSEQRLGLLPYVDEYGPTIHYIEGPRNVIPDTFSRLLHNNVPSTLVGKKAAHIVSNSELELFYLSLIDEEEILQCILNLLCCSFKKEKERRPNKCRICSAVTHSSASDGNNHFCESNAEHCHLNLSDDMIKDNPLDLENTKEKQDKDNDLYQSNYVCERMIHNRKYPKYKIYGDILPNIWGHIAKYMGTSCQYKIYGDRLLIQKNFIDFHAWHESRSTLHFRQQPRQSCFLTETCFSTFH
jgi:hypothetical protein